MVVFISSFAWQLENKMRATCNIPKIVAIALRFQQSKRKKKLYIEINQCTIITCIDRFGLCC